MSGILKKQCGESYSTLVEGSTPHLSTALEIAIDLLLSDVLGIELLSQNYNHFLNVNAKTQPRVVLL